jgi:hypothetical protein
MSSNALKPLVAQTVIGKQKAKSLKKKRYLKKKD